MRGRGRLLPLTAAAATITACQAHQPPPPRPSPCAITDCRPAKTLLLQEQGKGQFLVNAQPAPYVDAGVVIVRPGDDFFITADDRDGALVNLRRIDAPAEHAPNVIHIRYKQEQLLNGVFIMQLSLQSSFPRPLAYHAAAMNAKQPGRVFSTSTCPVHPGITAGETWNAPLWQLFLHTFRTAEQPNLCTVY